MIKTYQAHGVVLSRAERFLPERQKHMLLRKRSYAAEGGIVICEVFFSLVHFFSFASQTKEKE